LKVVVCYSIGYDTVDVDAATGNGVLLVNIPDFCLEEVSDNAIALLLACAVKIVSLNSSTKQGRWVKAQLTRATVGAPYE